MSKQLIGQIAPNFTLQSSTGESISLADYDDKWKVLFFYAKDGSPTCKRGCLSFKEQYELLLKQSQDGSDANITISCRE